MPASWATPQVSEEDQVEGYDDADFNFDEEEDEGAEAHSPDPSL